MKQSDLVQHRELLHHLQRHHVGILLRGLQMRHRLKSEDAIHILTAQHILFQKRSHPQCALQSATGKVRRPGVHVAGSLIVEVLADDENKVEVVRA